MIHCLLILDLFSAAKLLVVDSFTIKLSKQRSYTFLVNRLVILVNASSLASSSMPLAFSTEFSCLLLKNDNTEI